MFVCVAQYIQYVEPQSVDEARALYRRACEIHLPHKPNIHMHWATFEERHGTMEQNTFVYLLKIFPDSFS